MVLKRIALAGLLAGTTALTGCQTYGWQFTMGKPAVLTNPATNTVVLGGQASQQLTHIGGTVLPSATLPEAAPPVIQGPTVRAAVGTGLPAGPRFAATSPGGDCTCEDLLRELRAINAKLDRSKPADVRIPMPKAD